ncbi:hypothetical protein [Psychrobacter sp. I-STPA10]|uniref:hypothetical protein n=1 Tax=Psychrobacter sp. I-STPA10 TaxID=2585769 RepID=UPI001E4A95A8|nr:hypothetical protein [Psychrobacter sp. I-STPA10]
MAKRHSNQRNRQHKRHIKKTTLIIVGEGEHDKAFLTHMKNLYDHRQSGQKVKIDFSSGGSPYDIIKDTVKKTSHADYDRRYILMDDDIDIRQQDRQLAKEQKRTILLSQPLCLEGMLLDILKQNIPDSAQRCKKVLHPQLDGKPTEPSSYASLFDQPILDSSDKATIVTLRTVLQNSPQL